MDNKRQRRLSRLTFYEDFRVALPIIVAGLVMLAVMAYVTNIGNQPTVHATCRYQYFVISQSEWNAGAPVVICKLLNGKLASVTKPVGWVAPEFDSEMDILIPK